MTSTPIAKQARITAITSGKGDLVSFGRAMISNPDLPRRLKEGAPLNELFKDAPLYGGQGAHGYCHGLCPCISAHAGYNWH